MPKAEIHQHIINTSSQLFYKNGYHSTGINEIIAKCGIAKATLYNHFKSKEAICIAFLEQKHRVFMDGLQAFVNTKANGRPQLLAIFDFLRNMYREENFYGCWAIKTAMQLPEGNKNILKVIQKQKKELLLYLGELVSENIKNISIAETEKISSALYLLYESAITESYLHRNDWPIHSSRSIAQLLLLKTP